MLIKNFKSFLEGKSGNLYRYGCVMLHLNIPNWENIIRRIDEEDLYDPTNPTHGYEISPHITIIYGLHSTVKDEDVISIFDGLNGSDFDISIDGIECFENKYNDVVKMTIKSNKLIELNKELSKLPNTTDFPDYKPHMTLGYVIKGKGSKYVQPDYKYTFSDIDKIVYSKPNGEEVIINLK